MSKKIILGGGVALIAAFVAIASIFVFARIQPTEGEVRASVQSALPQGAVIEEMSFAIFPEDNSKGRVSIKGTYSFDDDIFTFPTPPLKLLKSLAAAQVFENEVELWWLENADFFPQFNGRLSEYRTIYSSGQLLEYSGELQYLAVVDGTKIDSSSLKFKRLEGTVKPAFGYLDDDQQVAELRDAIVEWRDRQRAEAAAAEVARVAKAKAAAEAAAKKEQERAAAAAKAAEERAAAERAAYAEVLGKIADRVWSGSVKQPSSSKTYSLVVEVESSQIVFSYPELGCSGVWEFVGKVGGSFRFREGMLKGREKCTDGGEVVVLTGDKDLLQFEWRRAGGATLEAWADLIPR